MNSIICNCCWSGWIYKRLNKPFDNPFFWSRIYAKDFALLMHHFYEINFGNVGMELCDADIPLDPLSIKPGNPKIILKDFNIKISYNHCRYSATDLTPRKENGNIYYQKNYKLCYETFIKRAMRIPSMSTITWLYLDNEQPGFSTNNDKLSIIDIANKRQQHLIFYTESDIYTKYNSPYSNIIVDKIYTWEKLTDKYISWIT